jgi:enamine deaminase RidA (YjgF/YER057c/UK114 family)
MSDCGSRAYLTGRFEFGHREAMRGARNAASAQTCRRNSQMRKVIAPANMPAPASAYHHGLLVTAPQQTLYLSGQLGETPDGAISEQFDHQAAQAWANVMVLLAEAAMSVADIVKVTSYIVGREHIPAYVERHRREVGEHLPPWTLILVEGLGRPEYLVEIDVTAAK